MKHVKEHEVEGERMSSPHARTLKHLAAPWTVGTRNLWVGISKIDPGNSSNEHSHDDLEEIFYVVAGHGRIRVGDEEEPIEAGSCIYIPTDTPHQLINTGDETLKVLAVTSPPFVPDKFKAVHR